MATVLATLVWSVLLSAALAVPLLADPSDPGEGLTRNTVRLALLYYAAAVALMLWRHAPALARCCWTLGWAAYLIHLGMAFHYYHHWSHADAVERTREVSGLGAGIYFSHLFTLLWTADVA